MKVSAIVRREKLSGRIESSHSTLLRSASPNADESAPYQPSHAESSMALQQKHHRLHYFNTVPFNFNVFDILLAFNPRMFFGFLVV